MMCRHPLVPGCAGAWWTALGLALLAGCGVFNPALTGTVTSSSTSGLEAPQGTILVAVFNTTSSIAAARFEITKKNGGTVELVIPVQPADNDPSNESDRGITVQDCDVQSITLVEVLASVPGGGVQRIGTGLAPLEDGVRLSCGKVVLVTIMGQAPNLEAILGVF